MSARHVMILASAGSGKTHALTNRFVALLAAGAAPERIVALTFTRKAAGEFFDKILAKLARASADTAAATALAKEIGHPELRSGDFLQMLRSVIAAMARLRLGTLDGFFAGVVRTFPLELGLSGQFEVMEEHVARTERRRVLRRLFSTAGGGLAPAQREFAEAFKRAHFGREEKRLGARLDEFLDAHHQIWLAAPDAARWGQPDRIWPDGCEWLAAPGDATVAARELRLWVESSAGSDKARRRWENFVAAVAVWRPGESVSRELGYVVEKTLEAWSEIKAGTAVLKFEREQQVLTPAACAALAELVRRVVGGELRRHLEMTRGLGEVLRIYEGVYADAVRRAGRLGFDDVRRLLEPGAGAPLLSQENGDEARLLIDYRLDGKIDHWLLDEFQDTSQGQWSILQNLVDEAVQDAEGRRSFFCVGDVKQAIFGWRGGEARLFEEIFERYNAGEPGTVERRSLVQSWRSGPPLVAMINAVFGAAEAIASVLPAEPAQRWNEGWEAHVSAVPGRTGQAALLHGADLTERRERMLALIREIEPLRRGLSCAVLVWDNAGATEVADYLRAAGVPAVAESDRHVATDNPATAALLALAQAAAHPGDSLAQEHVRMTPLGTVLTRAGLLTPEAVTWRVLTQIHAGGFERWAEFWSAQLQAGLAPEDRFSRERLRQFAAAAGAFDATGSRDIAEFVAYMRGFVVREVEGEERVRVMTVHKSKGLGFDVVILPEIEGEKLASRRGGLTVAQSEDRSVDWVFGLPPRLFVAGDETLRRHHEREEADAGYENLALLYVAMTRAQRAMYVLAKPPGKSVSRNYPRLLADALGTDEQEISVGSLRLPGTWSEGDPEWYRGIQAKPVPVETERSEIPTLAVERAPRYAARRPTSGQSTVIEAAGLFGLADESLEFGKNVHALLAGVEWVGTGAIDDYEAAWSAVDPQVREQALACLRAPQLADLWRPRAGAELWRERAFEVVLAGAWVSGAFDRVILERDSGGKVQRAWVFDFKTDRIADEASLGAAVARHTRQLETYRQAVAILSGLPAGEVQAELVFTQVLRRVALGAP